MLRQIDVLSEAEAERYLQWWYYKAYGFTERLTVEWGALLN